MISQESVFRRLPTDLPRRNIVYLDALRLSAEMSGIAYDRLETLINELSNKDAAEPIGNRAVVALIDAYTVIDSTYRFREVLRQTPGLKHNEVFTLFMKRTEDVERLRHIVQHLNQEADQISERSLAALGTVTWLGPSAAPSGPPTAWLLQAGTHYHGQITHGPWIDRESSLRPGELADVSISTASLRVNLTKIIQALKSFVKSLEGSLKEFAKDKATTRVRHSLAFRTDSHP